MRKLMCLIVAAFFMLAFLTPAFAEVDVKSSGTKVTTAVAVDFYGPTVTKSGGNAVVNMLAVTGDQEVTGNQTVTGNLVVTGTVKDVAIYTATPGSGIAKFLCMASDGVIYGSSTVCRQY